MFLQENLSDNVFPGLVLLINLCLETLFSLFLSLSPQSSFFPTLFYEEFQTHSKIEGILVNTYHLDCTINVLLCLPYHISIHLTIPLCILHIFLYTSK